MPYRNYLCLIRSDAVDQLVLKLPQTISPESRLFFGPAHGVLGDLPNASLDVSRKIVTQPPSLGIQIIVGVLHLRFGSGGEEDDHRRALARRRFSASSAGMSAISPRSIASARRRSSSRCSVLKGPVSTLWNKSCASSSRSFSSKVIASARICSLVIGIVF